MAKSNKELQKLELEQQERKEERRLQYRIQVIKPIILKAIPYGGWATIMYALAGRTTVADLKGMPWDSLDLAIITGLAITTICSLAWAWNERRLRKDSIKELTDTQTRLYQLLDPNRQTSHLTSTGDTKEGDE